MARPEQGEYGWNELAILGAPCAVIRELAKQITQTLSANHKIAYLDADHAADEAAKDAILTAGAAAVFTNKISYQQLAFAGEGLSFFQKKALFNEQDLVLINGNHFTGNKQIIIIDDAKPLYKKMDKLTHVQLILLKDESTALPDYLETHLPGGQQLPRLQLADTAAIAAFIQNLLQQQIPPVNGLVLTGGKSERMGKDKSELSYHGQPQKAYVYHMLAGICKEVFLSINEPHKDDAELPALPDKFRNIGPMGGILTALQHNPNAAWLVLACDLPYLTTDTLNYLMQHRNPSKMATAFFEPAGTFPEPLVTIWEPRSYGVLLQALSQGYTCPRKVLINSDIELLQAPDLKEFTNVNDPAAYEAAKNDF